MSIQNVFQRYEIKYLITYEQKKRLMNAMAHHMRGDSFGRSTICNLYYDTPDFRLIRQSLEKPVYKEKLRVRSYGTARPDGKVFVELKKKYRDVVYKRRVSLPEREASRILADNRTGQLPGQIGREIDYFRTYYPGLAPRVYISYDREAYFATDDSSFRVTFDDNILWRDEDLQLTRVPYGSRILPSGHALMEIKVSDAMPLWMVSLLTETGARKTSFSKYGRAYEAIHFGRSSCCRNAI